MTLGEATGTPDIGLYLRRADGKGTVHVGTYDKFSKAEKQFNLTVRDPTVTLCWILGPLGSCLKLYTGGDE